MEVVYNILKKEIEHKYGRKIVYSQQCESLAEAIYEAIGERLGLTTLKRFFGFTSETAEPRGSTLDILARYCGYENFEVMKLNLLKSDLISDFKKTPDINITELRVGDVVTVTYEPKRTIKFTYKGDSEFVVSESTGSKLKEGDEVKIDGFELGFELVAYNVVRNGRGLGTYVAAKQGGLTSISHTPG